MHVQDVDTQHDRRRKRINWTICGFLAVAAGLLIVDHWAHALGIVPYLFLLACPLMHLMHRGHGRHHHRQQSQSRSRP